MRQILVSSVEVDADVSKAWEHLIEPARWPSWAKHIKRVDMEPQGRARIGSKGRVRLRNGTSARQQVVEINELRNWRWDGRFLGMRLIYDHAFGPTPSGGTRITFTVDADGPGVGTIGRLFGRLYARNLARSLPNLEAELADSGHNGG